MGNDAYSSAHAHRLDSSSPRLFLLFKLEIPTHPCPTQDPTRSPLIEGRWRLLYNTKESTASPVQRAATGTKGLSIFQDILLGDASALPRVVNVVEFGSLGKLEVGSAGCRVGWRGATAQVYKPKTCKLLSLTVHSICLHGRASHPATAIALSCRWRRRPARLIGHWRASSPALVPACPLASWASVPPSRPTNRTPV